MYSVNLVRVIFSKWCLFFGILSIVLYVIITRPYQVSQENAKLTTVELLKKYGYPFEEHQIVTSDGYFLTLHRIPHGKHALNSSKSKGVIHLLHGMVCSSASWLITGPEKGLGFIMADAGYDVWMGNDRGNHYSRNHSKLDPDKDIDFWNFSWHESGVIDTPEIIDYILNKTGEEQMFSVGYSQGTTAFYVMASMKPEYNHKIKAHFSLAPVAYIDHMTSPGVKLMAYVFESIFGTSNNEFLPKSNFIAVFGDIFCTDNAITQVICKYITFTNFGFSYNQMNATLLPIILGQTPAGSSTRQFTHYSQVFKTGSFRQYDLGVEGNINKYNSSQPPEYNLKKITTDTYLLYSETDLVINEIDVDRLCNELGNCKEKYIVPQESFSHLDFIYGIHAPQAVYQKIVNTMASYN